MVDGYNQATNEAVKAVLYDAMEKYADEYHDGYVCYDMDMYTALYKCAMTSEQRKHALNHMSDIIIDDAFQYHGAIIKNFNELICLSPFIKKEDITEFDTLCMMELDFFKKELQWSEDQAKCGQADFVPDIPVGRARDELQQVANLIIASNIPSMESYKEAYKILKK